MPMKSPSSHRSLAVPLALWMVVCAGTVQAEDPWQAFTAELARAGEIVTRELTPSDPITQAEGYRYLARMIRMGLETTLEFDDPSRPHIFPAATRSMQTGGNTADAVYAHGFIDGTHTYRIRGERGSALLIEFTVYSGMLGLHPDSRMIAGLTEEKLVLEADGSFEVILSPTEQSGNWIKTSPDARYVFIRQYSHDWSTTRRATFQIERLGETSPDASLEASAQASFEVAPTLADIRQGLQATAQYVRDGTLVWIGIVDRARQGLANALVSIPQNMATTMPTGHKFASGHFELSADEALIVEFTPPKAPYWGFQLTNYWFEPIDYGGTASHVNNRRVRFGPNGTVKLVIAHAARPDDPNWLSTGGRTVGTMQFRLSRSDLAVPTIRTRLVAISEL